VFTHEFGTPDAGHELLNAISIAKHPGVRIMQLIFVTPLFAAAGWSLIYMLMGGGLGGAILIFIVLKMLGK
jgi:hypothetical protein